MRLRDRDLDRGHGQEDGEYCNDDSLHVVRLLSTVKIGPPRSIHFTHTQGICKKRKT
jgi:hypothetical protein